MRQENSCETNAMRYLMRMHMLCAFHPKNLHFLTTVNLMTKCMRSFHSPLRSCNQKLFNSPWRGSSDWVWSKSAAGIIVLLAYNNQTISLDVQLPYLLQKRHFPIYLFQKNGKKEMTQRTGRLVDQHALNHTAVQGNLQNPCFRSNNIT